MQIQAKAHKEFYRLQDGRKIEIRENLHQILNEDGSPTYASLNDGQHELVDGEILHIKNGEIVPTTFKGAVLPQVTAKMQVMEEARKKQITKLRRAGKI